MADVLRFVDAIAAVPTVRLDLNDDVTWGLQYQGTDFSPPPLRRALAATLLTDGARIPAAAYDNRTLRLRLDLQTTSVDEAATQLQRLYRELDKPTNVLQWQPGTTQPVFFRTFRSDVTQVTEYPGPGLLRTLDVAILAEPFGYGLREALTPVVVSNDPAAATNPCRWDITGVKGDVETPPLLEFDHAAITGRQSVLAVRRRGTPTNLPLIMQAETLTPGTDTAIGAANDAALSGAGPNYMRCTFATAAMTERLQANPWPPAAGADIRGTYRLYARVRKNTSGDTIKLEMDIGPTGIVTTQPTVTLPATASPVHVDLGLARIPFGQDVPGDGYSGVPVSTQGDYFGWRAQRAAGSGSLDFDYLLLVPADDRLAIITWAASDVATPAKQIIDGPNETIYAVSAGGQIVPTHAASLAGGFPMISPGVTNRIVFVREVTPSVTDTIGATTAIGGSYWPRYLYVKPPTT